MQIRMMAVRSSRSKWFLLLVLMSFMYLSRNSQTLGVDPWSGVADFRGLRIKGEIESTVWDSQDGLNYYFLRSGSSFVASDPEYDFSGIGIAQDSEPIKDYGTLISSSFYLAAAHDGRHIKAGETSRLYFPGSSSYISRIVSSSGKVGGLESDIQISTFSPKATKSFAVYPIYSKPTPPAKDVWCVGRPRLAAHYNDLRVAKRRLKSTYLNYYRRYELLYDKWQPHNNSYSELDPFSHILPTSDQNLNYDSGPITHVGNAVAGNRDYLLSFVVPPATSVEAKIEWYDGTTLLSSTVLNVTGTGLNQRKEISEFSPPSATDRLKVVFTKTGGAGNLIKRLQIRDITLKSGSQSGSDYCDVHDGDSGSPSFLFDLTPQLASSVPNPWSTSPKESWGLILLGTHFNSNNDSGITSSNNRIALIDKMKAMQSGPDYAKEVPIFWSDINGDFNGSESLDGSDIDLLTRQLHFRGGYAYCWYLDWDQNGKLEWADVVSYVQHKSTFETRVGDVDLDGDVDMYDVATLNFFKNTGTGLSWVYGDFDGDSEVTSADEALQYANFGWSR